ncbi:trifunctional purine biosynthetic protein adenosine-3 [Culicoides brevitarsis]|uniref:trifunctional purine biosynthetic protein adenosine-3 n=1 Tax=Culicoides brevitarsis TaxID=469753 RepID=UPI00307B5DF0
MAKNLLVIGSGGREHAICWKLSQSPKVKRVFALPGSPGIAQEAKTTCVTDVKVDDFKGIVQWCKNNDIYMVVVGPEDPLANGLADVLLAANILCFGPCKAGATIEASKDWAKQFMVKHGVPTARYESFTDAKKAKDFIKNATFDALVVKASGLAAGKGVIVANTRDEACEAVDEILGTNKFGNAGNIVVVEEKLSGEEISVLAFADENTVKVMLPAQDHKRIGNNDTGGNTGGMGAYCPCPLISEDALNFVVNEVLLNTVKGFRKEGIKYNGVLYAGIMLTPDGPKTLEFNCRFGDPETQVILPLLKSDLFEVCEATCLNKLDNVKLEFKTGTYAAGVVLASKGYPESSTKGCVIEGLAKCQPTADHLVFHSGVAKNAEGKFVTNGGRVLINVALRSTLEEAAKVATDGCKELLFEGAQYRTDIAKKGIQKLPISYKSSGVDIDAGNEFVTKIKPLIYGTRREGLVGDIGGFAGLFELNKLQYKDSKGNLTKYKDPVLVQGVDGVGTKIKLAEKLGVWDTIGIDLVAMCANDVICAGAEPFAFLDYIACGNLNTVIATSIVKGIAEGCREVNAVLIGGETAEMPSIYEPGKYDLAGYCVGIVEHDNMLPKVSDIKEGDFLIGLPSNGLHSNGFSLINKIIELQKLNLNEVAVFSAEGLTYGQEFLKPTRLYVKDVLSLLRKNAVKATAHITGGGLPLNLNRVLPKELCGEIDAEKFEIPPLFGWISSVANVPNSDLLRTFNCGVGMVLVVDKNNTEWKSLNGARHIGVVRKRKTDEDQVVVNNFDRCLDKICEKLSLKKNEKQASVTYQSSGVDIEAGDEAVQNIKDYARSTVIEGVLGDLGGFGGCFRLKNVISGMKDPLLALATDGCGTKLKIAQELNKHDTVGIDLVAMCVNDLLCCGAQPLTFLDYYACGKLKVDTMVSVVKGVCDGCISSNSVLLGGETAEMPGVYGGQIYDLAGFALGVVDRPEILPKINEIKEGDVLIGLPSSGPHSNGFSLIHKLLQTHDIKLSDTCLFDAAVSKIGEKLLTPTKIYVKSLLPLIQSQEVKALAHITGGGLPENVIRVLPRHLGVKISAKSFDIPEIFAWIAAKGNVNETEMLRTFNCGIGMVMVVSPEHAEHVLAKLSDAKKIGNVVSRNMSVPQVLVEDLDVFKKAYRTKKRVGVLISGNGSNLQALVDNSRKPEFGMNAEVVLVISNKPDAYGLERAKLAGIPSVVIKHKDFATRESFDEALTLALQKHEVDLVCLAGFMRILSPSFIQTWKGKLINIHPSLLPKFPGLNVQRQALEAGEKESGCTIHFVDEGVDTGAIILQEAVPIHANDTVDTLTQRIHTAEHVAYPRALKLIANGVVGSK